MAQPSDRPDTDTALAPGGREALLHAAAPPRDGAASDPQAALFEAVFNHVPDPMAIADAGRTIVAANAALERVFGYARHEVVGRSTRILYPGDAEWERLGRERFNAGAAPDGVPLRATFRRSNGEVFPALAFGRTLRDGRGRTLGFLGVIRDVTREVNAETDLRSSEQRFRDFASASSDWFWEMDEALRFSFFSERFTEVTGVPQEMLLGKTRRETGIPDVDPDQWRHHLEALDAHRPFRGFVHPRRLPDGRTVWLSISGVPHIDGDGRFRGYRGTGSDITDRVRAEQRLRESEERFRGFAEMSADFFWETDAEHRYTHLYGRHEAFFGSGAEEVVGSSRLDVILPCLDPAAATRHAHQIAERRPFQDLECRVPAPDGRGRTYRTSGRPRYDAHGHFVGYQGTARDVTAERRLSDRLAHQATHDSLTGLRNRRAFETELAQAIEAARRERREHSLCYLDLDQFKLVNDTCGHAAGDELLRQLGAVLARELRTHDIFARLGGDEFGVLLENCPLARARGVAEKLRRAVEAFRFSWDGKIFAVGVSIGVVPLGDATDDVAQALRAADSACYVAKDNGRNRVHVDDGEDAQVSRRNSEMEWVSAVARAIDDDRLELWYQPIAAVASVAPVAGPDLHFELLLRLRGEDGTRVSPGVFLPPAERYGMASRVDRWVLARALAWFREHPRLAARVSLCSINLSGQSLSDDAFLDYACEALAGAGLPASRVCFEITETAAIQNLAAATRFIDTVKARGCRFALDDFGSGLSSFAYLKTLDVDFVKIDGMFVKDVDSDPVDLAMVRSINEIGHVMGKRTIAEFVENEAILKRIEGIGVDFAQGYGIGRPAPLDSLAGSPADDVDGHPTGVVSPLQRRHG